MMDAGLIVPFPDIDPELQEEDCLLDNKGLRKLPQQYVVVVFCPQLQMLQDTMLGT